MEWEATEQIALDAAVRAADRRAELDELFNTEMAGKARPTALFRYSAEMKLLDKQILQSLSRVNVGLEQGIKSPRHQRAARARWNQRSTS